MNIIVKPYGSDSCHCRPDTTWERENKDFYCPDGINELHWTPIMFARVSKAGKCIGGKFASRYYDSFGYGLLLYIGDRMPELASASCADHTSLLPLPLHNPELLEEEGKAFTVTRNGEATFSGAGCREDLEKAICKVSELTSLRIGDYVAIELAAPACIAARSEGKAMIKADYCNNTLYDLRLIF